MLCIPLSLHISVCQVEGDVCLLILCCAMLTDMADRRGSNLYAAVSVKPALTFIRPLQHFLCRR